LFNWYGKLCQIESIAHFLSGGICLMIFNKSAISMRMDSRDQRLSGKVGMQSKIKHLSFGRQIYQMWATIKHHI
jgi:hypothetical protein